MMGMVCQSQVGFECIVCQQESCCGIVDKFWNKSYSTPSPCFTPFCFNASFHFTPLLNLRFHIFSVRPFGSLCSSTLSPDFWWEYHFWLMCSWFTVTFIGMQLGHKKRAGCSPALAYLTTWDHNNSHFSSLGTWTGKICVWENGNVESSNPVLILISLFLNSQG
jgi:hypothetical protein